MNHLDHFQRLESVGTQLLLLHQRRPMPGSSLGGQESGYRGRRVGDWHQKQRGSGHQHKNRQPINGGSLPHRSNQVTIQTGPKICWTSFSWYSFLRCCFSSSEEAGEARRSQCEVVDEAGTKSDEDWVQGCPGRVDRNLFRTVCGERPGRFASLFRSFDR